MFSALKSDMANKVHNWYKRNPGQSLDKYSLIAATLPSFEDTLGDGNTVRQSFRISGLDGWNPGNVNLSILNPSLVFVGSDSADVTSLEPAQQPPDVSNTAEDSSPLASQPGAEPQAVNIPHDVMENIDVLDKELMEGDITQKGYEKKKSKLLAPFLRGHDSNLEILDRAGRGGDQSTGSSSMSNNIIGGVGGGEDISSGFRSPSGDLGGGGGGNSFNNGNQGNSFFIGMNDSGGGGGNSGNIDRGRLDNMSGEEQQRDMMRSNSDMSMMGSRGDMIGGNLGGNMMRGQDMRDMMGSSDIMDRDNFRDIPGGSTSVTMAAAPPPLYPAPSFSDPPILHHSPELSLENRKRELNLFETVNIRNEDQLKEFRLLFENGNYNVDNGLFQSWLPLKMKALGNEREAFQFLLKCRQPKAMEKRKKKRKKTEPEGPDKYDLTSQAWNDIWRSNGQTVDPEIVNNNNNNSSSNNKRVRKTAKKSQDVGPSSTPLTALTPASLSLPSFSNLVINFDHNKTCVSKCFFLGPEQKQSLTSITSPNLLSPEFVNGCIKIVNCNFRLGDDRSTKELVEIISNFANIPGVSDYCQVRLYS